MTFDELKLFLFKTYDDVESVTTAAGSYINVILPAKQSERIVLTFCPKGQQTIVADVSLEESGQILIEPTEINSITDVEKILLQL